MSDMKKILLIGGTKEAVTLNRELFARPDIDLVTSLAGRTAQPATLKGHVVTGGFGGTAGLADFIDRSRVDLIIDASHPYAEQITRTAITVCRAKGIPCLRYLRPAWEKQQEDHWIAAGNMEDAPEKTKNFNRVFLSIGRQELAHFEKIPRKYFLVRTIEPIEFNPENSQAELIRARGPFTLEDEARLMVEHRIDLIVSKNSGGAATYPKIEAARQLRIPVVMIDRPETTEGKIFSRLQDLIAAIDG